MAGELSGILAALTHDDEYPWGSTVMLFVVVLILALTLAAVLALHH